MQETGSPLLQPSVRSRAPGCNLPEHGLLETVRQFTPMSDDALSETAKNVIGRILGKGLRYGGARTPFIFPIRENIRTAVQIVVM